MKLYYFITILFSLSLIGCSNEEPDFFADTHFIKFKYNNAKEDYYKLSYNFSNGAETTTEYEFTFPVEFMGRDLNQNLYFGVEIDPGKTTLPSDCYSLIGTQLFRLGSGNVDSVRIKLFRKPVLKKVEKVIRLRLVNTTDFQLYMPDSSYIELTVVDIFSRPEWWNETVAKAYLGKYSRKKYDEFIKETGAYNFGTMEPSEKRYYAIMFKRALEREPRKDDVDEDGIPDEDMSITVSGS